jgi:hypothetical protein
MRCPQAVRSDALPVSCQHGPVEGATLVRRTDDHLDGKAISRPPREVSAEDSRRNRRHPGWRRPGFGLAIGATSVAGGAGGGYVVGVRLTELVHLAHVLRHDGLLLVIVVLVLGWRMFVYLERRERHRCEIISGMRDQEGVYQRYEDGPFMYVRQPMMVAAQSEQHPRRTTRSGPPQTLKASHGSVVPLDRYQQIVSGTGAAEGGIAGPAQAIPHGHEHPA